MLFLLFLERKLAFKCFGIICESFKKSHNLVYLNTSSLKYECPQPSFELLLAKTLHIVFITARTILPDHL